MVTVRAGTQSRMDELGQREKNKSQEMKNTYLKSRKMKIGLVEPMLKRRNFVRWLVAVRCQRGVLTSRVVSVLNNTRGNGAKKRTY